MYNFVEIEKKWQKYWEENNTFKIENDLSKPKYYCLDMFPYPSWAWLHVWHPKWYTANDIIARYKTACWHNVLHPMWWDAFWLPAENYAIKTGTHPRITTDENITTFKRQIKELWFSYDWSREIDTTNPKYYKWTQFIFLKLFESWLAYEQDLPINYCPHCKTSVANEEVLNDFTHERCGTKVEKKKLRQWVLAITKYADRLLADVDRLDWPESIKEMQRNWIGKSEWCEFEMKKAWDNSKSIRVYTTRIDTVFGMSYVAIAPDHKDIIDFITPEQKDACLNYIEKSKSKSDQDRINSKEKTWVFTGSYVINPFNWEEVPLWIWDYVLGGYWTWAVMAVPAHDLRDFEFAKKYDLFHFPTVYPKEYFDLIKMQENPDIDSLELDEIKNKLSLLDSEMLDKAFIQDWYIINVSYPISLKVPDDIKTAKQREEYFQKKFDYSIELQKKYQFLSSSEARKVLTQFAEENNFGKKKVNYKLRDWLFSRQRYWWEPIPLIHLELENLKKLPHIEDIKDATDPNLAYILKRNPCLWESTYKVSCKCGHIRELVIWWKVFSKIYDWLYTKIVVDYRLPLKLPEVDKYEPSQDWQSPLARVHDFVNVKLADNLTWKRETNTMPQWWWSCWYYLRYMDPNNEDELVWKDIEKYWWQVDSYIWWAEHAVLHLLYARFWHKFLYDIWIVSSDEPFFRLRNQWLILAHAYERKNWWLLANDLVEEKNWKYYEISSGEEVNKIVSKMSKSLKNVVNPEDIIKQYWADSLRLYEMYIWDFKDWAPWDSNWIIWVYRFLEKSERLFTKEAKTSSENDDITIKLLHKTIKKVWEDIENYKFNTAIASIIVLVNNWLPKDIKNQYIWRENFCKILHPFAPHLREELWERMNKKEVKSLFFQSWPKYDENLVKDDTIIIAIQILGKLRWEVSVNINESKEEIIQKAKEVESVKKWLSWKEIIKEIYVPWKIVNIVIK